jgi:8-hydroxy-5-deazaflavin:NADPH oxidoreductase
MRDCQDSGMTERVETSQAEPIDLTDLTIGVLGGTGEQGRGLARRWARAGLRVRVGSRQADRAVDIAADVAAGLPGADVAGEINAAVAAMSDVVVVAVPFDGHAALLSTLVEELRDTVVVDVVNPLGFDKQGAFALDVPEGSAAQQAQALLPHSAVVGAFHHVSAIHLLDDERDQVDTDVLVVGDDRAATDLVQRLADAIPGVRGVYAGRLRNAGQVEALTANLISVNRRYKAHAGVRVTDV